MTSDNRKRLARMGVSLIIAAVFLALVVRGLEWREVGEVLRSSGVKVFQIETTVNNDLYGDGPLEVLAKREWEWNVADRATFMAARAGLDQMSANARRKVMHGWRAPYGLTSVQAGEVEAAMEALDAEEGDADSDG